MTLAEAARFLRLKPQVVAQQARTGALPGRQVAGQWCFLRAALVEWLKGDRIASASQSTPPLEPPAPTVSPAVASQPAPPPAAPAPPTPASAAPVQPVGEKSDARTATETALRDQGVLLPAGRTTVETGLSYQRAERQNYGLLRVVQNTTTATAAMRYGLRDNVQVSARLPVTHRSLDTDVVAALGDPTHTSDTYAGDLAADLLRVVAREGVGRPNVIVSADAVLPTGPGDRGLGAGIVLSKSYDPVVLFAGASYMHGFSDPLADPRRSLARHNIGFNAGYVYALNDSFALSGAFIGSYKSQPSGRLAGTIAANRETYQLQFGATMQVGRGLFVEPSIGIGLGASAPDLTLSVTVPYTF